MNYFQIVARKIIKIKLAKAEFITCYVAKLS